MGCAQNWGAAPPPLPPCIARVFGGVCGGCAHLFVWRRWWPCRHRPSVYHRQGGCAGCSGSSFSPAPIVGGFVLARCPCRAPVAQGCAPPGGSRLKPLFGTAVGTFFVGYRVVQRPRPRGVSPRCSCPGFAPVGVRPIARRVPSLFIGYRTENSRSNYTSGGLRVGAVCPPPAPPECFSWFYSCAVARVFPSNWAKILRPWAPPADAGLLAIQIKKKGSKSPFSYAFRLITCATFGLQSPSSSAMSSVRS